MDPILLQTSAPEVEELHLPPPKIQIYPTSTGVISSFWKEKYERDAKKYWEIFYKRHQDKFFKDRHYLDKEWGHYFSGTGRKVILEVGCGAGNTVYPLLATYPDIFVHACDFSPRAVNLVKTRKDFEETRINAFVCDLTADDLCQHVSPSVDIVTMIFVLSAVTPEKMSAVIQNIGKVLKPDGFVLFRDYAMGDLAQERLILKEQKISDNFYVRGDGTRAFYFSEEFLTNLFKENGFETEEHVLCFKQVENRSREIVMNRRWVQAVFRLGCGEPGVKTEGKVKLIGVDGPKPATRARTEGNTNGLDIDISDGIALEMFGISSSEEVIDVIINDLRFKINVVSREYQHTCKSTGLMLWECARVMATVLSENPGIVAGKRVLELGSGCAGICSMVAASTSAELVVPTDGDPKALELLDRNLSLNLDPPSSLSAKPTSAKLEWGNGDDIASVRRLNGGKGFDVIIGTDVAYVPEAIAPLFATARELISPGGAVILCHVPRRVDEPSIRSAASESGFELADRWPETEISSSSSMAPPPNIIKNWLFQGCCLSTLPTTGLMSILYFHSRSSTY